MVITAVVGENDRLVLPEGTLERLQLSPGRTVRLELGRPEAAPSGQPDAEAFKTALLHYAGSMRGELERRGYGSVDELMEDIRPTS